jgi:hypothetical protein
MNHIICPVCHELTDEKNHNMILCDELYAQSKVAHKFSYSADGNFTIILILRKKHVVCVGSSLYKGNFGIRINKFLLSISPFEHCDSLDIINKLMKNRIFI